MSYAVELTLATPITRENSASACLARLMAGKAQYEQAADIASQLVASGWQMLAIDERQTDGNHLITYRLINNAEGAAAEAAALLPDNPVLAIKAGELDSAGALV